MTPRADLPGGLPPPAPQEQETSARLARRIRAAIRDAGGSISFARFMGLALYAPGLGYYSTGSPKFGAAGDFVTAPELGGVFARCLARQCHELLALGDDAEILEVGAGTGALAADLLPELETLGTPPAHYSILELSAALRARQAEVIRARAGGLAGRVRWLDRLPAGGFRGIVLGNEVLDAMPVERFRCMPRGILQQRVGWKAGGFVWRERRAAAAVSAHLAPWQLPAGYVSEVGLRAQAWVRRLGRVLERGVALLIDYGFPRAEYYHPQRVHGTLMCHYRHRVHDDPLILVGLQDITAHVDFTTVAEAAAAVGLDVLGYCSQADFLISCGLESLLADSAALETRARLAVAQQVKRLTLPQEMGELYKVIALGRGVRPPLLGFRQRDRRGRL